MKGTKNSSSIAMRTTANSLRNETKRGKKKKTVTDCQQFQMSRQMFSDANSSTMTLH